MRGDDNQQEGMFSYISPEKRVPADHPLRPIRKMVDEILKEMSPRFAKLYSDVGRPSLLWSTLQTATTQWSSTPPKLREVCTALDDVALPQTLADLDRY